MWIGELRQVPRSAAVKSLISSLHQLSIELDAIEDLDADEDADAEDDPLTVKEPANVEDRSVPEPPIAEDSYQKDTTTSPATSIKVSKPAAPPSAVEKGKSTVPPVVKEINQPAAPQEDEAVLIDGVLYVVNVPSVSPIHRWLSLLN